MSKKILIILITLCPAIMPAQTLPSVWQQVSERNLTLRAAKQHSEAEKISNHVGLAPENPEAEFAYLWGNPESIGNRIDFSITQSFEFPTAYVYRSKMASIQDEQLDLAYQKQCLDLFSEVGELYYNVVYQNIRIKDMEKCLHYLAETSEAYQQKLEAGSCNIFDYNKVKLAELNLQQEMAHAQAERDNTLLKISQLNGGEALTVSESEFPDYALPADFDGWYQQMSARNPELQWLAKQQTLCDQQVKLAKSMWAPQFFAGYMREQVPSETFQGVKVGISVPLWNSINSVKQSQLHSSAIALAAADEQFRLYNELKAHYLTSSTLLKQVSDYKQLLTSVDALVLLKQALDSGEISLIDFLMEASIYHESHERLAKLQHDAATQYLHLQILDYYFQNF